MRRLPSYPHPLLRNWRPPAGVPAPNLWYRLCRACFQVLAAALWRVEVFNRHYEPPRGPALYISNHQSFLDPPLMSLALRRPMNFMARESLFRHRPFARFITSLNAFPVKRASADTAALKEALRRLRRGEQLVVFPEGTRTADGRIGPFLPGVALLARRAAEWVVPVLIEGAFEAWPRTRPLPVPGRIVVAYCRPLGRGDVRRLGDAGLLEEVRRRLIVMQGEIRRRMGRRPLCYDAVL